MVVVKRLAGMESTATKLSGFGPERTWLNEDKPRLNSPGRGRFVGEGNSMTFAPAPVNKLTD